MGVYTLKELEKLLQSVASINGMQVKEYLQALQDENLIRVEKIGSGNWYWCFLSDAKKGKENMLNTLGNEEEKLKAGIKDMEKVIKEEMAMREVDDGAQEDNGGLDRTMLMEAYEELTREMEMLDKGLSAYSESDPDEVLRKIVETRRLKDSAIVWTDNIEAMESFFTKELLNGDRQRAGELMETACAGEYVLGEGLKDL